MEKEALLVNEIMAKVNGSEKLVGIGAIIVIVGWVIGIGSFGLGGGFLSIAAAVAALVLIYLKYAPNTGITWTAQIPLILLICGGICLLGGIFSVLAMLAWLSIAVWAGLFWFTWFVEPICLLVGGALMTYGGYQDYKAVKPV
jgi:hypothetical protein